MSEYTANPSTGKLKLKGVKEGRVDKKKKKKKVITEEDHENTSVVLDKLEKEESTKDGKDSHPVSSDASNLELTGSKEDEDIREHLKTDAEKRYDEQRKRRLEKRMEKEGIKTHKQRVEELNRYLSNLSEHHDMPKIGPG